MDSEDKTKAGETPGEMSETKENAEKVIDETAAQPQDEQKTEEPVNEEAEDKKETVQDSDNSPIKVPEAIEQGDFEDDEYVIPALLVQAQEEKQQQEKTEIDAAMEDEEFRKYYEKYYNRKTFGEVFWKNRGKGTRALIVILIILIAAIGSAAIYINAKLNTLQDAPPENNITVDEQIIYDEEEIKMMNCINSAESLKDYLFQWANNDGELMSSPNVINVLLLGIDGEDGLENGGRSDVIMLLSLNKKTEKINISSIYRDTWLYMDVDDSDKYTKLNAAYFYGGAEGAVKTFEENFKIKIDFYATVDFSSFTDIINALGGITIEVEEYEANYINRTTVHEIEYGPAVTLDGWEALVYARIRHCDADSDVSRTRRQRKVITTLIQDLKNASYTEMYKALSSLFGYVKTNLSKSEMISYMIQALKYKWMNYEITETVFNDGEVFGTGYVGDYSTVFMDMPMVAYRLQEAIYGNSNIVLSDDRATVFDTVNASRAPMPEETTAQEETTAAQETASQEETTAAQETISQEETTLKEETTADKEKKDKQKTTSSAEIVTDINGAVI
ncbi:MAG: LCP family protein [Clostridia bacterium]|nr:LCP family protein [Clostridia bacterium]